MRFKLLSALIATTTLFGAITPVQAQYFSSAGAEYFPKSDQFQRDTLCTDIALRTDAISDKGRIAINNQDSMSQSNSNSESHSNISSRNQELSGSGSYAWGLLDGKGGGKNSSHNENHDTASSSSDYEKSGAQGLEIEHDRQVSNAKLGHDCSAYLDAAQKVQSTQIHTAGQVQMNYDNTMTNREAIKSKEKVRIEEINSNSQMQIFNNLMQGW
ncbi:hypothetical protein [Crocosphaera chwakensis]|uniref:Secreted protein n=1 Tax=Crocosphaera chwakensis CCY0110 TaxID=391612 RepID=A3IXR6_9CHRO|nr:hypothetical protein [Crocosphaera chwakensis]EAZ88719.1 hypothetical protein CY0110_01130 [Crocosphaera chwakensis CCY0110]